ncbi:MAG: UDP-N-acetylmuramoyl-tripeptide--D-alanyl-D-alanine ligase [Candidatus Saccharimonadales bacterium]
MRKILRNLVLQRLEAYVEKLLGKHQPKVIAITGSVGKTSTKQAIAQVLSYKFSVLAHEGNYNTEFGLPLSLFELEPPERTTDVIGWLRVFKTMRQTIANDDYPYDVVVLEMGADRPGDIKRFMSYIRPDIGVVTAVAKVHLEEFKSIEAILREKWLLAETSKQVFYNHDDERLRDHGEAQSHMYGYGLSPATYWMDLQQFDGEKGWGGDLFFGDEGLPLRVPVIARQAVYSLVAAAAVAHKLGVGKRDIIEQLAQFQQPKGRMRVLQGKNGSIILDDSYNASPYSGVAALDALSQFTGRKLAILGTMNELGEYEAAGHRLVGRHCGFLDRLMTIGQPANEHLVEAAEKAGVESDKIQTFASPQAAGEAMVSELQSGDVVLVKGSQNGVFAEEAVKLLLADPKDADQLVRQSQGWLDKKREQFRV